MKLRNYQRRFGWGRATASKALYSYNWNVTQPASKAMRSCDRDHTLPQQQRSVPVIFSGINLSTTNEGNDCKWKLTSINKIVPELT